MKIFIITKNSQLSDLIRNYKVKKVSLVGYDQEMTQTPFESAKMIDLVQLFDGEDVALIKLAHIVKREKCISKLFTEFLKNNEIIKSGVGIIGDSINMRRMHGIEIKGTIDSQSFFLSLGKKPFSMDEICGFMNLFPNDFSRDKSFDWKDFEKSTKKIKYAAIDAIYSYEIYKFIVENGVNAMSEFEADKLSMSRLVWIGKYSLINEDVETNWSEDDNSSISSSNETLEPSRELIVVPRPELSGRSINKALLFLRAVLESNTLQISTSFTNLKLLTDIYEDSTQDQLRKKAVCEALDYWRDQGFIPLCFSPSDLLEFYNQITDMAHGVLVVNDQGFVVPIDNSLRLKTIDDYVEILISRLEARAIYNDVKKAEELKSSIKKDFNFIDSKKIKSDDKTEYTRLPPMSQFDLKMVQDYLIPQNSSSLLVNMMDVDYFKEPIENRKRVIESEPKVNNEFSSIGRKTVARTFPDSWSRKQRENSLSEIEYCIRLASCINDCTNESDLINESHKICQEKMSHDFKSVPKALVVSVVNDLISKKKIINKNGKAFYVIA